MGIVADSRTRPTKATSAKRRHHCCSLRPHGAKRRAGPPVGSYDSAMGPNWQAWHDAYADPASRLSRRLAVVQALIRSFLDSAPPGPIRAISMCAGEGRDILGVLADHPRAADVSGRLVELDPDLAERARAAAAVTHAALEVATGDAGRVDSYAKAVRADLVLVCGVFGNIPDADIEHTIQTLPSLCAPRATVLWTRHRRAPDLTPTIRSWFAEAGFEEVAFETEDNESEGAGRFGVGANRLTAPPTPFEPGTRLFTFFN